MTAPIAVAAIRRAQAEDFTRDLDLTRDELVYLLELTAQVKKTPGRFAHALAGRYLSLLFEKPSLRTRMTFELAIKQLGGDSVFSDGPIGDREPLKDVARNLDRWTDGIVARTFLAEDGGGAGAVVERAGDQRAERPVPSLPGAGGHLHAEGAVRQAARPEAGVRRRRKQRGALADALLRRGWA